MCKVSKLILNDRFKETNRGIRATGRYAGTVKIVRAQTDTVRQKQDVHFGPHYKQ